MNSSRTPAASLLDDRRPRSVALARGRALPSAGRSRRAAAVTHRQHHNYGNCNIINDRCNPLVSLVALDEPPTHRRRYEMNLLSRRSVLAIAAVVDVALHSRSAPVARQSFGCASQIASSSPGDIAPGPGPRQNPQGRARAARAATSWRASAGASLWARSCAPRCR